MKNIILLITLLSGMFAFSQNKQKMIESQYSFEETLLRLRQGLGEKNIKIFSEIDHFNEAEKVGLSLSPTKVFIVGNPKIGTLLMQENPAIAIHLPLKILVFEKDGKILVQYLELKPLIKEYQIEKSSAIIKKIDENMLNLLTEKLGK